MNRLVIKELFTLNAAIRRGHQYCGTSFSQSPLALKLSYLIYLCGLNNILYPAPLNYINYLFALKFRRELKHVIRREPH